jgi:hypothetical protein
VKIQAIRPEYVGQLPDRLEEGVLYIAEEFNLTAHKCCCGCGEDVYNKLSPVKWRLIKMRDGSVSLEPSVGNWKYACESHYWIRENRVIDAGPMSVKAIEAVKKQDRRDRDKHIARVNAKAQNFWQRSRAVVSRGLRYLKALWPN